MKKYITIFALMLINSCALHKNNSGFYEQILQHCGKTYLGETVFPSDSHHPMVGKKLEMFIRECSKQEIKIPFKVGDDASRTWIITKVTNGFQLKHDHRKADGSPDEINMYGGFSQYNKNSLSQSFAADEHTKSMLPEAATNVWTLSFNKKESQFIYELKRHNKMRYKAIFKITN